MLYFLYQFYQGISHEVFTAIEFVRNGISFISNFTIDIGNSFENIDFPPLVLAVLTLIFILGLFDKIVHLLKG